MSKQEIPPVIVDDMQGLYSHASEVYRAGQRSGRDDFFRGVQALLGQISVKYESAAVSGPGEPLATRSFHVAQECAKAVSDLKQRLDAAKTTL